MSVNNVQFAVACHILTALAYRPQRQATSSELADSVRAHPTFVRKTITRLVKAGLVVATRGVTGACSLARAPEDISLLAVYHASEAPPVFALHRYPVEDTCAVSVNIKDGMDSVLARVHAGVEQQLASMTLQDLLAGIHKAEIQQA